MGYSCTVRAQKTLEAIEMLSDFDCKTSDYLFNEIGNETKDGSITGNVYSVWRTIGEKGEIRRPCKLLGRFKIDPMGKIVRFPGLTKRLWGVCEIAGIEAYDKDYPIYSLDSLMVAS